MTEPEKFKLEGITEEDLEILKDFIDICIPNILILREDEELENKEDKEP
jgi:hypothetical protein